MDFSHGQTKLSQGESAAQHHMSSIWRRPFASRGLSAPSVPTSLQFIGASTSNEHQFHPQLHFNAGQLPKQQLLNAQFQSQPFPRPQFSEQEFCQDVLNGSQFPSQHFLNSNMYADVLHSSQNTLAIHNQEFQDRNETKPRLAKTEVELLERHFQENHKPPSSLKRQLAESMNVQVARINNWFQNRRAKAKHERKQEAKSQEGETVEADADHHEDFDFAQEFPDTFEDEEQSSEEPARKPPHALLDGRASNDAKCSPAQQEVQRSGTEIDRSDFDFAFDQGGQFNQPPVSSSAPSGSGPFVLSSTSGMTDFQSHLFENSHAMAAYNEEAFVAQLMGAHDIEFPMGSESTPDAAFPSFPSQLLGMQQQHDNFAMSNEANAVASTIEPVQEDMMMRFMSPPPATDIASRRSKRRPAPIGTDAIKDRSSSGVRTPLTAAPQRRVTKSPGTTIRRVSSAGALRAQGGYRISKSTGHPSQSPLRPHFDFSNLNEMNSQVNVVHSNNGGLAPPTPRSPTGQYHIEDHGNGEQNAAALKHHAEQIALINGTFWNHDHQFSPPETPGQHSNGGSSWGYDLPDQPLHTPSFGAFPSDPFLQMHQPNGTPSYVASSGGFAPGSLNDASHANPLDNGHAGNFDMFDALPMPPYMTPELSNPSVSPLSTSDRSVFTSNTFEQRGVEGKPQMQYRWDQQPFDLAAPVLSSPEQAQNKALVFHHATPKDFEGKPCSGQQ